jgi:hypothetical protein
MSTTTQAAHHRLEDVVPLWRAHFAETLAASEVKRVRQSVQGELAEQVDTEDPGQKDRIGRAVRDAVSRRVRESVVPACLRWLRDQEYWDPDSSEVRASNEIGGASAALTPFEPRLPAPTSTVRPHAWVVPAALGAALGPLVLTPLAVLLPRSLELVLFVGGVLGAGGLVGLIGMLASDPKLIASLESGLKWFGVVAVPLGLWRGLRGRPIGWIRAAVSTLGAWLVLATVRPRPRLPSRGEVVDALEGQIRGLLFHDADLVLALCWAHPDRVRRAGPGGSGGPGLAGPAHRAIRDFRAAVRDPGATREDLVESAESLLQRLEEVGYRWVEIEKGTRYSESLDPYFEKYGMVEVGQPVEMLQPALCKQDGEGNPVVVVEPGRLRRARNRGE